MLLEKGNALHRIFSAFIESSLILTALLAPLAFGTVDLFVTTIMEILVFSAALIWLSKSIIKGEIIFVKTALNIPAVIFLILIILQYIFGRMTSSKIGSIYPYATKMYFFEFLFYIFIFLLIINNIHTRRQINKMLFVIIFGSVILSIFGILQKSVPATRVPLLQPFQETVLFYSSRYKWLYESYVNMAIFLSLSAFLTYLSYLDKKRGYYKFDISEGWNSLFILAIAVMIIGLFYSFSYGGIFVFLVTIILFFFIFLKQVAMKRYVLFTALVSTTLIAFIGLIWLRRERILDYLYAFLQISENLNMYGFRIPVWVRALNLIKLNPIFGIGLGTFQYIFPKYQPNSQFYFPHCHNDYLQLFIETGLLGFLAFYFGLFSLIKKYLTLLNSRHNEYVKSIGYGCLVAIFSVLIYSFIDSNIHQVADMALLFLILGLGSVVIHNRLMGHGDETLLFKTDKVLIRSKLKRTFFFFVVFLIFLNIIANIISICVASIYASIGKKKEDISYIEMAVKLEPLSSEYHELLANTMLKKYQTSATDKEILEKAIRELKKSTRLNPNFSRYHQKLGLAYTYKNERENVVREFKKAQDLEPWNAFNYVLLAIYYFNEATKIEGVSPSDSREMEEGVAEYKKALSIDPSLNIGKYKKSLRGYRRIKAALKRYSL